MTLRFGPVLVALAASFATHLAVAGLWPARQVTIPGGSMAGEIALGTSFANLASGTLQGLAKAEDVVTPTSAAQVTPTRTTEPVRTAPKPEPLTATTPQRVTAASPVTRVVPAATAPVADVALPTVAPAPTATEAPTPEADAAPDPVPAMRPVARPAQRQRTDTRTTDAPAPRQGNAEVTASAGQQSGRNSGTVTQSTQAEQTVARQAGQGEVNDYTARVAARVIRVAERMRSRGSEGNVIVGMQIAANGALSAVSIVQSSGNPTADAIARDAVTRAAPFDPPPQAQPVSVRFGVRLVADR